MRYALATLMILFLLIVGVIVVAGQTGGSNSGSTAKVTRMSDYSGNATAIVSWTTQSELVGDDEYRSVRVTVSPSQRVLEVLSGYNDKVIKRTTLSNSSKAFEAFMSALDRVSFGREREATQVDEKGFCPLGNRYVYTLNDSGSLVLRTWSDSCLSADGTFGGNATTVRRLFRAQITDYDKLIRGVKL